MYKFLQHNYEIFHNQEGGMLPFFMRIVLFQFKKNVSQLIIGPNKGNFSDPKLQSNFNCMRPRKNHI